jgi:hypothetical protein
MAAGVFNLTGDYAIAQGSDLSLPIVLQVSSGVAWDLTAATIAAKIRRKFSDSVALQVLTVTVTDAVNGAFKITLTAAETAALSISTTAQNPNDRRVSLGVYDIEVTDAGIVTRVLEGTVELSQEATKT